MHVFFKAKTAVFSTQIPNKYMVFGKDMLSYRYLYLACIQNIGNADTLNSRHSVHLASVGNIETHCK